MYEEKRISQRQFGSIIYAHSVLHTGRPTASKLDRTTQHGDIQRFAQVDHAHSADTTVLSGGRGGGLCLSYEL